MKKKKKKIYWNIEDETAKFRLGIKTMRQVKNKSFIFPRRIIENENWALYILFFGVDSNSHFFYADLIVFELIIKNEKF